MLGSRGEFAARLEVVRAEKTQALQELAVALEKIKSLEAQVKALKKPVEKKAAPKKTTAKKKAAAKKVGRPKKTK